MMTITQLETPPWGLYRREGHPGLCLRVPLFVWYGTSYDPLWDKYRKGWQLYQLFLRFNACSQVIKEKI